MTHHGPPGLRVGVDLLRRGRLRAALGRLGPAFAATLFGIEERASFARGEGCPERSFATKEALVKAMGTGLVSGLGLLDIGAAEPERSVSPHGALRLAFTQLGWRCWARTTANDEHVLAVVWLG